MKPPLLGIGLCSAFVLPLSAQTRVWLVDDHAGPGVHFTQVSAAVAAAADDDAVLVRPGTYGPVVVDGKSLTIQADGSATVDSFRVQNLVAGQNVALRGFVVPNLGRASAGIVITDDAGTVWVEDCSVSNPVAPCGTDSQGILVRASSAVVLIRTSAQGSADATVNLQSVPCGLPAAGLRVEGSEVHAFECTFVGGHGGAPSPTGTFGGEGGAGVLVDGGLLFLSGSSVTGGEGGRVDVGTCMAGAGGSGVELLGSAPFVSTLGSAIGGGAGGPNCSGCACTVGGPPGPPTRIASGSVQSSPRTALRMTATAAPREFSTVTVDMSGPPGHAAFLAIEKEPSPLYLSSIGSSLLVTQPTVVFFLGFFSTSGTLSAVFPTARNGVGEARPYWIQPGYLTVDVGAVLGSGSMLLLLDEDY